jgi:hypothetical protein
MDLKLQRIAAWGGIVMLALFFVFFMLIAKLIPPLSPTASAKDITDFLIANKLRVRVGLAVRALPVRLTVAARRRGAARGHCAPMARGMSSKAL